MMDRFSRLLKLFLPLILVFFVFLSAGAVTAGPAENASQAPILSQTEPPPLVESGGQSPVADDPDPAVIRSRPVRLNLDALGAGDDGKGEAQITLNLFDDVTLTARLERREMAGGSVGWAGRLADTSNSSAFLVVREGVLVGNVKSPQASYRIRPTAGGGTVVQEIDESAFPEQRDDFVEVELPAEDGAALEQATDDGSVIDVMVVYTPPAEQAVGGPVAMAALIDLGMLETNASYANSNVNPRVRLVHQAQVDYMGTGNPFTDLARLRSPTDGYMDEVHTWRDTYGADLVSMWLDLAGSACGVGYLLTSLDPSFESSAFNVVHYGCATGNYSFGHEMGHNMGLRHDWYVDDTANSPFSYNHGYTYFPDAWRTIMAYNDNCTEQDRNTGCLRVPYWSNPNILYGGVPMGVPAGTDDGCAEGVLDPACDADNRLALNNTALTVANFRQTSVIATLTKSVSSPVVGSGEALTYTLVVSNQLSTAATGIVITDTVPANTVLNSGSLSADAAFDGTGPGSTITWTTGQDLAQGQTLQRSFAVTATAGGFVTNTAYVYASNSVRQPSNLVKSTVLGSASCGYSEGFESGALNHFWQTHVTEAGRVRVLTDLPRSGSYSVVMDSSVGGTYSDFGVILSLNLAGASTADLDFYWYDLADEYQAATDGVFIRDDTSGAWSKVYDFSDGEITMYQAGHIDLETAAANNGLLLTREFQVKFQGNDNWYFIPSNIPGSDGYALDDLQLACSCNSTPASPAVDIGRSGSQVVLDWNDATDVANYELWRSADPYFTPGDAGSVLLQDTAQTSFSDGVIGAGGNHFYLARAANACGNLSPASNRAGKVEFVLEPGTAS